jgi:hypothetical protein
VWKKQRSRTKMGKIILEMRKKNIFHYFGIIVDFKDQILF